jgi:hypothetical protein
MWEDEIVEETRRIRKEYAAQFKDLAALCRDLQEKEAKSGRKFRSRRENQLMSRCNNERNLLSPMKKANTKLQNEQKYYAEAGWGENPPSRGLHKKTTEAE